MSGEGINAQHALHINVTYDFNSITFINITTIAAAASDPLHIPEDFHVIRLRISFPRYLHHLFLYLCAKR